MNAIIVEDEIAARQYLEALLRCHFPSINIVAVADSVPLAYTAVKSNMPDILFLDIEIKLGTGFDLLAKLPEITSEIIFTTAFDQFAIEAFRYHAMDYLLKPLEEDRVVSTVRHCIKRIEQKNNSQQISSLLKHMQQQRIAIHTLDGIDMIDTNQILYAAAKGNYTEIILKTGAKITASKKLKEIEDILQEPGFFRTHHSYIVNMGCIKKYYKGRGGYVILANDISIPISETRRDDFLRCLGVL